jgi:hypothetical protein
VDRDFKSWLRQKLEPANFAKIPEDKLSTGGRLMREFEDAKTAFRGADDHHFYITVPAEVGMMEDPTKGISEGEMSLGP